jgi:hypothetical protein
MSGNQHVPTIISFGPFEADLQTQEPEKARRATTSAKLVFPDPGDAAKKTRGIGAREELQQALCLR